ncbi:MAG TPA: mechanosensitive ion channel family protein [Methanoregulaceae archaeon]|nr:mechanosensitive ion channel family protein [Methanoregulaceae archaeon]
MIREYSAMILITAGAAVAWLVNYTYPNPNFQKLFLTLVSLAAIYLVFEILVQKIFSSRITDKKTRYTLNKVLYILSIVLFIAITISIWVEDPTSLLVTFSIIGAGIAFALQDVFKNFVGGMYIIGSGLFKVGDRIEIDEYYGDVMDIGIMNTTMMEIRGWVQGDQASGRLLSLPNGYVLNKVTFNYTKDHSFIWDELFIPITYDSDWRLAISLIKDILKKETESLTTQAQDEIERLGERYYLPRKETEAAVYMSLTDNWINLEARYVTDARTRRIRKSKISRLILEAVEEAENITIASETSTITVFEKDEKKA